MLTDEATLKRVKKWIGENEAAIVADLQDFVRIKSVSRADLAAPGAPFGPDMRRMLDYALERGAQYGFETADHEGYCGSVFLGDRDRALGIFAHLDTVPEGEDWCYPPFEARRVGDRIFGRGVADNKGSAVMGLHILRMARELGLPFAHGLRLVLGCSEETGMEDVIYYARTQAMPVASVVPDAGFPANFAQKGTMNGEISIDLGPQIAAFEGGGAFNMVPPSATARLRVDCERVETALRKAGLMEGGRIQVEPDGEGARVRAQGAAAHAARPQLGVSAFQLLAHALAACGLLEGQSLCAARAIERLAGDFDGEIAGIACEDDETGKTTMVLGLARTEEGRAIFSVDCRLSIATDWQKTPEVARRALGELGFAVRTLTSKKPFYLPVDDARIQALSRAYRELTGRDDPPYASGGGTYSRYLENAITFGPGFPDRDPAPEDLQKGHGNAHAPDECVFLPDFFEAMYVITASLLELDKSVE